MSLRSTVAQLGWRWASLYALHVGLRAVLGRSIAIVPYLLYAQPIGADAYAGVRDDDSTRIERVGPDADVVRAFPRPPAVLAERFAAGAQCHVARVRDRFAAFLWIDRNDHDEDEVRCRYRLPADGSGVWDFDVYVEPDFRVGRTLARLWKSADAALAADGVRWSFSRISAFNRMSVTTHERLGARCVGRAVFFVAGGVQLALLDAAPFLHLSAGQRQGPVLQLRAPLA
jgi:hypothetical protein